MTNQTVVQKSNVSVEGFQNVIAKSVNIREREGKAPLIFVELIDSESFETTGELLILKEKLSVADAAEFKALEKKPVKVTLKLGTYNGRSSINITEMKSV